jgi:HEAT repeat protein
LMNTPPNQHRAVVAKRLVELAKQRGQHNRGPVLRALGTWGTVDEVPFLAEIALGKNDPFGRKDAIDALGKLREPQSLKTLIACFRDSGTRDAAEKAPRKFGPPAEPEVLPLLNEMGIKREALRLLKDIGTQQSVPALQALVASNNFAFRAPAQEALNAIAARTKK